jgi:hypothetical protein
MLTPDHCSGHDQCWVEHGRGSFFPHPGCRVVLVKKGQAMGRKLAEARDFAD